MGVGKPAFGRRETEGKWKKIYNWFGFGRSHGENIGKIKFNRAGVVFGWDSIFRLLEISTRLFSLFSRTEYNRNISGLGLYLGKILFFRDR